MQVLKKLLQQHWSGFGTTLKELTGNSNVIMLFQCLVVALTMVLLSLQTQQQKMTAGTGGAYHSFAQMNVAGSLGTNSFIKNRLSAIEFHHKATASASDEKFTSSQSQHYHLIITTTLLT